MFLCVENNYIPTSRSKKVNSSLYLDCYFEVNLFKHLLMFLHFHVNLLQDKIIEVIIDAIKPKATPFIEWLFLIQLVGAKSGDIRKAFHKELFREQGI